MGRKHDYNYFEAFVSLVDYSCTASNILHQTLNDFNVSALPEKLHAMHNVEHEADVAKHDLMHELAHAFITPIEREDIVLLAHALDDVTDAIEDVLIRIYIFNITAIPDEAFEFSQIIIDCCNALKKAMEEFSNFKKPDKLYESIIEINRLEEDGDRMYMDVIRTLYVSCKDPIKVMSWTEIYDRLEKCCDTCEHAANLVEGVIMKNS